MTKYEKLIEYIISDQEDLAKQLFHEIVVEKSREIYEGIVQDEDEFGGDEVDDFMDDIEYDEDGIREAEGDEEDEDEFGDEDESDDEYEFSTDEEDDADMDMEVGDEEEFGAEDEFGDEDEFGAEDGDLEDRILDLETAMDELRAEFANQEAGDEEEFGDEEEAGDEEEFGAEDEMGDEEDDSDYDVDDDLNQIREYVEKINNPVGAEGKEAAKGGTLSVNKDSVVAKKNDMGGSTKNVVKGGSEKNPDGKAPKEPSNYAAKGRTKVKHADQFENVPKAKTKGYTDKRTAVRKEPAGVNKTSVTKGSK